MVPAVINCINNIERIGDHVVDISELCKSKLDKNLKFTDIADSELREIENVIIEMFDNVILAIGDRNEKSIKRVAELEDKADSLCSTSEENHIKRLDEGTCNVDAGVIYIDIISHLERIADYIYKTAMLSKDELYGEKRKDCSH